MREPGTKNLGREVAPLISAERTSSHNPGIRHGAHRRWDIFTAFLAADREVALPGFRKIKHEREYRRTKGESQKCKSLKILRAISLSDLNVFISVN